MKREIETIRTITGQTVFSDYQPTVICRRYEMLEEIFGENVKKAKIFAYHCLDCPSKQCRVKTRQISL